MNERTLLASINGNPVGTLHEENGIWIFRYADAWITHPDSYALSPHLPLKADPILDLSTTRPVQWYFDNLLPEENQRILLASDARLDAADAFCLTRVHSTNWPLYSRMDNYSNQQVPRLPRTF